jgi:hypothetical protein
MAIGLGNEMTKCFIVGESGSTEPHGCVNSVFLKNIMDKRFVVLCVVLIGMDFT